MSERLRRAWQHRGAPARLLWPLSQLYGALVRLRHAIYACRWLRSERLPVPVIVVGNVVAGGSGKTPVTIALAQHLRARGWHPGVISRGWGRATQDCRAVLPASSARDVGDEPLLIARRAQVPVYVAPRRADAGRALLAAHPATDILLCDDGLQHLALARDLELCVFSDTGAGNGWLLPAGPLREPWPRAVDAVLYRGTPPAGAAPAFAVQRALADHAISANGDAVALGSLVGQPLHALAGIAEPETFFTMLRAQGLTLARTQILPDHHDFDSWQRPADKRECLICTEKDAVKLWRHASDALAVPLQTTLAPAFLDWLDARLASLSSRHGPQTA
ncbi:MAG: tetraacyldisaccharide 4'-kinase [Comamonas sp. SCN 65-56]|uniref:tetraacyldisaccharide 4'-kinase n=1 Tax=Comamonas sp. SCN 65-56 TaxID=1660095 RepID=UPI000868C6EB|nr:tetraacyldisaccharide 4'-kinase [Comamonas sp. SCN 65-56]ODS91650.1 MAG: tetraacyldisaccharide 4'-kinase [Comamonas sp. SCN 65-56]